MPLEELKRLKTLFLLNNNTKWYDAVKQTIIILIAEQREDRINKILED